jgi:hypothetical protein
MSLRKSNFGLLRTGFDEPIFTRPVCCARASVMRKMIKTLNAMLCDNTEWHPTAT